MRAQDRYVCGTNDAHTRWPGKHAVIHESVSVLLAS